MSEEEEPERPTRLDPDRAIADRSGSLPEPPARQLPEAPIDVRRYQWMIGGFGLTLVVIFSIYLYASHGGSGTVGIPAGQPLHHFVAPLAKSDLSSDTPANAHPRCNPARPARRGLNVCGRQPLVLTFFATGAGACIQEVDALQAVSRSYPHVQFAAVAVNGSQSATRSLIRRHRWTIPVAFDPTDAIGELYGVEVCPLTELARPGGIVDQRLIGKAWLTPAKLAPRVAQLVRDDARR